MSTLVFLYYETLTPGDNPEHDLLHTDMQLCTIREWQIKYLVQNQEQNVISKCEIYLLQFSFGRNFCTNQNIIIFLEFTVKSFILCPIFFHLLAQSQI